MRNQDQSAGLRVPFVRSITSSILPRGAWLEHSSLLTLLLFSLLFVLISTVATQGPQRDPAGIATGDKHQAVDAAGNSFVAVFAA